MFTIDLLNGRGRPPRGHPLQVAAVTLAFVALTTLAVLDAICFFGYHGDSASEQRSLAYYNREIARMADIARTIETAEKDRNQMNAGLAEVSKLLSIHTQWSGILVGLTETVPETVKIVDLLVKREEVKVGQKIEYTYSLTMGVMSPSGSTEVETFVRALQQRMPLHSSPDSIRIISQRQENVRGRNYPYYVIECRLKSWE